jgi:hypothetical protein
MTKFLDPMMQIIFSCASNTNVWTGRAELSQLAVFRSALVAARRHFRHALFLFGEREAEGSMKKPIPLVSVSHEWSFSSAVYHCTWSCEDRQCAVVLKT